MFIWSKTDAGVPEEFEIPAGNIRYIDPSLAENGDGLSPETAWNSWLNVTFTYGVNAYLQKAGTTEELPVSAAAIAPPYNDTTFGAYGKGNKPKLVMRNTGSSDARIFYVNSRINTTIRDYSLEMVDCHAIYGHTLSQDLSGFKVLNCNFSTSMQGAREYSGALGIGITAGRSLKDCAIENNCFTSPDPAVATINRQWNLENIRINNYGIIRGLRLAENTFHDLPFTAFRIFCASANRPNLPTPVGVQIERNRFVRVHGSPLGNEHGATNADGYESYILNNVFLDSGAPMVDNINVIQGQNMHGIHIAYNYIENVYTSKPDGAAIILDWAGVDFAFPSNGCFVHHNVISGCRAGESLATPSYNCKGISAYVGKDNLIYSNYIYDCSAGIGVGKAFSSGNKVFNNTIIGCRYGLLAHEWPVTTGSSLELVANNIIKDCKTCLYTANSSSITSGGGNCFFNYENLTENQTFTPDSTDLVGVDPVTVSEELPEAWVLSENSPCIHAGVDLDQFTNPDVDTTKFGLNDRPLSAPPTIGTWQP